jgi:hypothetical protein
MARHIDPIRFSRLRETVMSPREPCVTLFSPTTNGALRLESGAAQPKPGR